MLTVKPPVRRSITVDIFYGFQQFEIDAPDTGIVNK